MEGTGADGEMVGSGAPPGDGGAPGRRREHNPGCRVYVSNLAWRTTWKGLKDHMRSVGEVAYADVFRDRETQRSRGCGVVEFLDEETAKRAIAEKNETELDGRQIFVREDRH
ncbi:hypothetical protein CDCA_CDCA07G2129 [Cyanidium caldarium]|uniref:RRM domain-containing protein n=1 Tax=Cyanidium caldarium TaxID=2771 RepID=A0AAV9IVD7_CYACA|nr:hypothetical protein CDCA_CDCA07G2129 [Cyanidium caldarium]